MTIYDSVSSVVGYLISIYELEETLTLSNGNG